MKKLIQNQRVINIIKVVRPWLTFIIILLVLRFTGALSYISTCANTALVSSGFMDVDVESSRVDADFDYNFTIKDLDGKIVDMKQFKDKVLFINLWATWCGPCRAEMPSIQSLYEKVDKNKVVFIILDWFEEPGKVSKFINSKKYTFPVYIVNQEVPAQLNVPSIPTTFVVSPEGKIVTKKSGTANYDTEKFKNYLEGMD